MLAVRKITPEDKDAILRISSKIWQGGDYVPAVFDKWVSGTEGEFAAVTYDGQIVGFGNAAFLTPVDVWLEGLRKDPDTEVKGIGNALSKYYVDKFKGMKLSSVRFSTHFSNTASITINERLGFKLIHKLSHKYYWFGEQKKDEPEVLIRSNFDVSKLQLPISDEEICDYIEGSSFLANSANFISIGWVSHSYSRRLIKDKFIASGQYLGVKKAGQVSGLLLYDTIHSVNSYDRSNICFIAADNDEVAAELLYAVKVITARKGLQGIEIKSPTEKITLNRLEKEGFKSREKEDDYLIYEFPLSQLL